MANNLTITSGDSASSQTTTGNPQNVPTANTGPSTSSGGVQPGTTSTLLTTSGGSGVPLGNQNLTTVNLNASATTTATTTATSSTPTTTKNSPVVAGVAIALFIIAIIVFVFINRSAKTTTNY